MACYAEMLVLGVPVVICLYWWTAPGASRKDVSCRRCTCNCWRQTQSWLVTGGLLLSCDIALTQAARVTGGTSCMDANVTAALDTDTIAAASSAQAVQGRSLLCGRAAEAAASADAGFCSRLSSSAAHLARSDPDVSS